MAFKLIEVVTPEDRVQAVLAIAEELDVDDVQKAPAPLADGRRMIRLVVGEIDRQGLLDRLQGALGKSENWRIVMLPTDAVIPFEEPEEEKEKPEGEDAGQEEDEGKKQEEQARASREELYHLVEGGVRTDSNFILLVFLSTVVASVGLEQDSVAILIGAMVIAPLLGPNVAFAFGAAIGDRTLMLSASKATVLGVVLSILIAGMLAFLIAPNVASHELMARTSVDYAGIALALASGAAAALSVTTGLSSDAGRRHGRGRPAAAGGDGRYHAGGRQCRSGHRRRHAAGRQHSLREPGGAARLSGQGHQAEDVVRTEERAARRHRQHRHLDRADRRAGRDHCVAPDGTGLSAPQR